MKQKIIFDPVSEFSDTILSIPKPATNYVPSWFKEEKLFSNGENDWLRANKKSDFSGTYKLCIPVVDSLTAGYMIATSADIVVENRDKEKYNPSFFWKVQNPVIDTPDGNNPKSLGNYPIPYGYAKVFARWNIDWTIKTPKEYSLWVTHPAHRYDLPFLTINGFVDTDLHPGNLKLPFFIRDGFEGIIEENTPIAQIIPIRRDDWESSKGEYDYRSSRISYNKVSTRLIRAYKEKFWSKKIYR